MEKDLFNHELTRRIIGCLFESYKQLGYGYQEKYYQRSFALKLTEQGIPYKRELKRNILVNNRIIGRYFVDFLIDDQVAVEMKVAEDFYQTHTNQLLAYLKSYNIKIGILAIITLKGIKVKRYVN